MTSKQDFVKGLERCNFEAFLSRWRGTRVCESACTCRRRSFFLFERQNPLGTACLCYFFFEYEWVRLGDKKAGEATRCSGFVVEVYFCTISNPLKQPESRWRIWRVDTILWAPFGSSRSSTCYRFPVGRSFSFSSWWKNLLCFTFFSPSFFIHFLTGYICLDLPSSEQFYLARTGITDFWLKEKFSHRFFVTR